LQARSGSRAPGGLGLSSDISETGLMELLEGKLAVLRFQVKIKDALNQIASTLPSAPLEPGVNGSHMPMEEDGFPFARVFADESRAQAAKDKADELCAELKSITQLYNDYAVRFELWEVSRVSAIEVTLEFLIVSDFTSKRLLTLERTGV